MKQAEIRQNEAVGKQALIQQKVQKPLSSVSINSSTQKSDAAMPHGNDEMETIQIQETEIISLI